MADGMNLEQRQREDARWRILKICDAGRPVGVSETIVWRVLADVKLGLTTHEVRREMDYLADLGMLEIEKNERDGGEWFAKLTPRGVDVVEYTIEAPAGIARP